MKIEHSSYSTSYNYDFKEKSFLPLSVIQNNENNHKIMEENLNNVILRKMNELNIKVSILINFGKCSRTKEFVQTTHDMRMMRNNNIRMSEWTKSNNKHQILKTNLRCS